MCGFAEQKAAGLDRVSFGMQTIQLGQEDGRINHNAITNKALFGGMKNPRRDKVKNKSLASYDDGMAGIITPLEAHNNICIFGKEIDDLPLAFVSPLCTDNNYISHANPPYPV
jgi:hypothetical protein